MNLLELFNTPAPEPKVTSLAYRYAATAYVGKDLVTFSAEIVGEHYKYSPDDDENSWECAFLTNNSLSLSRTHQAIAIYSFIKKVLLDFIADKSPKVVYFGSDETHLSFYKKVIPRLKIPGYEITLASTQQYTNTFVIKRT